MTEMIKMQSAMIEMGQHCLEFSSYVNPFISEYYYDIMRLILLRGELDLG